MTHPDRAIEAGARARVVAAAQQAIMKNGFHDGNPVSAFGFANSAYDAILSHLAAEGFVVVPKETFFEIANRAGNMSDPDAADWLPSIYRIAMEAAGEDPWPTLRLHGYDPDNISASFDTMAKNGEARAAAQEPTCK